jgi:hypothetical protein
MSELFEARTCGFCSKPVLKSDRKLGYWVGFPSGTSDEMKRQVMFLQHRDCFERATQLERDAVQGDCEQWCSAALHGDFLEDAALHKLPAGDLGEKIEKWGRALCLTEEELRPMDELLDELKQTTEA